MHVYANRHTGDSLACRHYHLGVAATFPSGSSQSQLHCGHAGPTGAGVCVGNPLPTEFCTDFLETCGADSAWPDATTCAFNVDFMVTGTPTASMEDTYGCRLAFLRAAKGFVAGTSNRSTSCARASYSGADGWCQGGVRNEDLCLITDGDGPTWISDRLPRTSSDVEANMKQLRAWTTGKIELTGRLY
eukprot:m.1465829 g.1465829  ORF g.1465829 m.1465829 type:complete len:188 (+) comp25136_c0_seq34:1712-2275(+)